MARPEEELADKVAFLRRGDAYPDPVARVDAIETHMSWVFLADGRVYKLKKPVRYDFLDYSTREARRIDCEAEVRLNSRLAPEVYVDVVPLTRDAAGRLALAGTGEAVDWLVEMRRLPAERMLDRALATGTADPHAARDVAAVLADFHRALAPVALTPAEYRARLARDIEACRRELAKPAYGLRAGEVHPVAETLDAFLGAHAPVFDRRVAARRVVEGHGDLRPEHVCLLAPPLVIDCLTFNRDLRILDAADEIAYLALECERLGHADFAAALLAGYRRAAHDDAPDALVHFYCAYRGLVRAKIAAMHTLDAAAREVPKWIGRAREYLALAASHARQIR